MATDIPDATSHTTISFANPLSDSASVVSAAASEEVLGIASKEATGAASEEAIDVTSDEAIGIASEEATNALSSCPTSSALRSSTFHTSEEAVSDPAPYKLTDLPSPNDMSLRRSKRS